MNDIKYELYEFQILEAKRRITEILACGQASKSVISNRVRGSSYARKIALLQLLDDGIITEHLSYTGKCKKPVRCYQLKKSL